MSDKLPTGRNKPRPTLAEWIETLSPPKDPDITVKEVEHALQMVTEVEGSRTARTVLIMFRVNNVSELKPEHYRRFIDVCSRYYMKGKL